MSDHTASSPDPVGQAVGELYRVLAPLLAGTRRVALLDFPDYANVGDSAIWLGELRVLRQLGLGAPCYVCDPETYRPEQLARRLKHGTILLSGGGNLGDLWADHQNLRERVVGDFPDHRIIQLPQSIHFDGASSLERARMVFDRHPDLTLLVRDRKSLAIARAEFKTEARLCPDMALALGRILRPAQPTVPVLWHSREDKEAPRRQDPNGYQDGRQPVDWLEDVAGLLLWSHGVLKNLRGTCSGWTRWFQPEPLHRYVAEARLRRGLRLLSRGQVVVTNRLHGHILCLLMGIKHYVSDNRYGKLRSFIEAWTSGSELVTFCETEREALDRASAYATTGR